MNFKLVYKGGKNTTKEVQDWLTHTTKIIGDSTILVCKGCESVLISTEKTINKCDMCGSTLVLTTISQLDYVLNKGKQNDNISTARN